MKIKMKMKNRSQSSVHKKAQFEAQFIKKLSYTEAGLEKSVAYKKSVYSEKSLFQKLPDITLVAACQQSTGWNPTKSELLTKIFEDVIKNSENLQELTAFKPSVFSELQKNPEVCCGVHFCIDKR